MATQVQNRRGTTAEHSTFTGANGELTVDTTKRTLVVHDGATVGGRPLLREDQSNLPTSAPTTGIYNASGSLAISTNGSGRLFVDSSGRVGIGTASPAQSLSISSPQGTIKVASTTTTNSSYQVFENTALFYVGVDNSSGSDFGASYAASLSMASNYPMLFKTSNTERLRITSAGLVGVGTSTFGNADADDLTVAGSGNTGITVRAGTTSASNIYFADGTTGDDAVRGYFAYNHSADRLTIGTNAATAVTIDSSQRVGIGTTSASANLHVSASSGTAIKITETNNGVTGALQATSSGPSLGSDTNHPLIFYTNAVEKARLTASGQLLVGTSTSFSGYGMNGVTAGITVNPGGTISIANGGSGPTNRNLELIKTGTATGEVANFYYAGTTIVGSISITASATAYNTSSDYRLKENVTAVTDGITRLQQLKPSRFNFIADPAKTVDGFIAHEAQAVVPEAVTGTKDAVDADGNPQYQGIDQSKLVPLLTAALQEAVAKIESLEARLTAAGI